MPSRKKRTRSASKSEVSECTEQKRRKVDDGFERREQAIVLPKDQSVLHLHAIQQPYSVTDCHDIPAIERDSELLVRVEAVGLNPIDWKAP
jgi:hypothetical protein